MVRVAWNASQVAHVLIGRGLFTKLADENGVDAQVVERDYVLTHVVAALGELNRDERLIFKGGTALRLLHFDDYRYSADLDFSLIDGMSAPEAIHVVAEALETVKDRIDLAEIRIGDDPQYIHFAGPLGSERTVKLDLSEDELAADGGCDRFTICARYPDQTESKVLAYTPDEIAAEKLRCVIQRVQARDLFDLHELFVIKGIDPEMVWPNFEAKSIHKHIDPGIFFERYDDRILRWKKIWDREMDQHVPESLAPHFAEVERRVRSALRPARK